MIVTPTMQHHAVASAFLDAGKPVLVEKPLTADLAQADDLVARAARHQLTLQIGHIERFNPALPKTVLPKTAWSTCLALFFDCKA